MFEILGLIGSLCFAVCSWPLAYACIRSKTAEGIDWSLILLHLSGAFFSTIYAFLTAQYILLPNFMSGGSGMFVVFLFKLYDWRRKHVR